MSFSGVDTSSKTTGRDWVGESHAEAQQGIEDSLALAKDSKELSMAQALGKFMKAAGDACKSMAP